MKPIRIGIIGAGIGGLTAAALLSRGGFKVEIFEQAKRFSRLGAGIQQSANAVRVLRTLGLEPRLREVAYQPQVTRYRDFDTGRIIWEKEQGRAAEDRLGAPHLLLHRGDLHELLLSAVPNDCIRLDHKLKGFEQADGKVHLSFQDGKTASVDALISADGVHSLVREQIFGVETPRFTGRVAYRTTFAASRLKGLDIDESTKWIAPDRHIVIYYINPRRDEVYFVTSTPEPDFVVESWSTKGDLAQLRKEYSAFHPQVRAVLDACPEVHKWALVERDPMASWGQGRVVLLGDACHPMTPYMAQGAASAMEDAAVLSRCLADVSPDGIEAAFKRYEATRKPRTSFIQEASSLNSVDRLRSEADRIYGFDAFSVPLADLPAVPA